MNENYEMRRENGAVLAAHCRIANNFWRRFRGLMGRKALHAGEGLLLLHCGSIHCCFMRFPIDVVYLDDELTVVGMETVAPWHLGTHNPRAKHVLELAAGASGTLRCGEKINKIALGD